MLLVTVRGAGVGRNRAVVRGGFACGVVNWRRGRRFRRVRCAGRTGLAEIGLLGAERLQLPTRDATAAWHAVSGRLCTWCRQLEREERLHRVRCTECTVLAEIGLLGAERLQLATRDATRWGSDEEDPVPARIPAGTEGTKDSAARHRKCARQRRAGLSDGAPVRPGIAEDQDQPVDGSIHLLPLARSSLRLHISHAGPDVERDAAGGLDSAGIEGAQVLRADWHLQHPSEWRSDVRLEAINHLELTRIPD